MRRTLAILLGLGLLAATLVGVEAWYRLREPSEALLRFCVSCEMNLARWAFLARYRDHLLTEPGIPPRSPNQDVQVPPEPDRPAFDRVATPYHVRTNSQGFREREPPPPVESRPRLLVLGDSVSFGKGVEQPERYSDLLQASLPARQVLNLALPGCTTRCMARVLDEQLGGGAALVVVQASMNDLDLTLWREADGARLSGPGLLALKLATASRALLALTHLLFGDPQERQWAESEQAAERFYASDAAHLLDACRAARVPLLVVEMPYATGRLPRHPLVTACRARPADCLGVVEVALTPRVPGPGEPVADWVQRSAAELGYRPQTLARLFPLADHFHDVVHAAASGHRAAAQQIVAFLQRVGH
jgi:hypothetical protein